MYIIIALLVGGHRGQELTSYSGHPIVVSPLTQTKGSVSQMLD